MPSTLEASNFNSVVGDTVLDPYENPPATFVGDDYIYELADAWRWAQIEQVHQFAMIKNTNRETFDDILQVDFTSAWCVSDDFNVDSISAQVYNIGNMPNARVASTVGDWATASTYLSVSAANSELIYSAADAGSNVAINREVAFPTFPTADDTIRLWVEFNDWRLLDSGDMVLRSVCTESLGKCYSIGLEYGDSGAGPELHVSAYKWDNIENPGVFQIDHGSVISLASLNNPTSVQMMIDYDYDNVQTLVAAYVSGDNGATWTNMNTGSPHWDAGVGNVTTDIGNGTAIDFTAGDFRVVYDNISPAGATDSNAVESDFIRAIGVDSADAGWTAFPDLRVNMLDDFMQ
jgi:hypothetical protein